MLRLAGNVGLHPTLLIVSLSGTSIIVSLSGISQKCLDNATMFHVYYHRPLCAVIFDS